MAIPVSAKGSGNFTPHPEGQYAAVCVDVHDVGMKRQIWNGNEKAVHKVDLYFFCGEWLKKDDGTDVPMLVRERFTASLHVKSKLRPFVEKIHGKLTDEECEWFDLESLIGKGAMIEVVHRDTEQATFANIDSLMRLPKGASVPDAPPDYMRVKDRPPRDGQSNRKPDGPIEAMAHANRKDQREAARTPAPSPFEDDDDLPF